MERFDEIVANIQKELRELQTINQLLEEENASLREKLGMTGKPVSNYDDLPLLEAFEALVLSDTYDAYGRQKTRAYNSFARGGFRTIGQFKDTFITELADVRNAGITSCAIMLVILEHFGVEVVWPEKRDNIKLRAIRDEIPKVRENSVFTK